MAESTRCSGNQFTTDPGKGIRCGRAVKAGNEKNALAMGMCVLSRSTIEDPPDTVDPFSLFPVGSGIFGWIDFVLRSRSHHKACVDVLENGIQGVWSIGFEIFLCAFEGFSFNEVDGVKKNPCLWAVFSN